MTTESSLRTRTVAAVSIERMAPLDLFGPIQAFNLAMTVDRQRLYKVISMGFQKGPLATGLWSDGPQVVIEHSLRDEVDYDILLVPGGMGTRELVHDEPFLADLRFAAERAPIVACVCTGSAIMAATGFLDGKRATTNKTAYEWVTTEVRPGTVDWTCPPRWVDQIDYESETGLITSGGVSAGTDMALALIGKLNGKEVLQKTTELMEWNRAKGPDDDPFRYLCPADDSG